MSPLVITKAFMRSVLEMNPPVEAETIASGVKVASAMEHLRNNRVEWLLVLVISHMLGLTAVALEKAQGVCY